MANRSPAKRAAAIPHGLGRDELLEMYRLVRLTRSLEEKLELLFKQSKVIGGLFRSLGQEGESVASAFALRRRDDGTGDMLSPLIRNLGSMLTIGARPVEVVRQYMAKGDSPARGKELNIHFTDYRRGFIGQISPLGDLVPVMAGVALTFKQRGEDRVGMVYIGDGATSTGAFHEGINFAAVQRCPLVVIVENNGWAYSTPTRMQTAAKSFADKAAGYGAAADRVDGNDMLAVYGAAKQAVERARAGEGVTLIQVDTYRRRGTRSTTRRATWTRPRSSAGPPPATRSTATWPRSPGAAGRARRSWPRSTAPWTPSSTPPWPRPRRRRSPSPLEARTDVTGDGPVAGPWYRLDPPDPTKA
jgi:TPP-dependent pyruvate/acetoin dehydrogenase alpha subunit